MTPEALLVRLLLTLIGGALVLWVVLVGLYLATMDLVDRWRGR